MAVEIIQFTGFESGGDDELVSISGAGSYSFVTGGSQRSGDYGFQLTFVSGNDIRGYIRPHDPATGKLTGSVSGTSTIYLSFYVMFTAFPGVAAGSPFFEIRTTGGTRELSLFITAAQKLAVYDANNTIYSGGVGATTVAGATWNRIDLMVNKNASVGDGFELRLNRITELSEENGEDFTAGTTAQFLFGRSQDPNGTAMTVTYDDFAVGKGGWMPASYEVTAKVPDYDGTFGASPLLFDPTTNKPSVLDDVPHDSDTTYVAANTANTSSWSVGFEKPSDPGSVDVIFAIRPTVVARRVNTGSADIFTYSSSGYRTGWSSNNDVGLSTTYQTYGKVHNYQFDPEFESERWNVAALEGVEILFDHEGNHSQSRVTQALIHYMIGNVPNNGPINFSTIHGNVVFNNSGKGIGFDTDGSTNTVTKVMVASNVVFDDADGSQTIGLELETKCEECVVIGNTFASKKTQIRNQGENNDISHNIEDSQ